MSAPLLCTYNSNRMQHYFVPARLVCSDMMEVARPAILLSQPRFTSIHLARCAAGTLRRVGAVVVGNVIVTDVTEPDQNKLVSKIATEKIRGILTYQ